MGNKSNAVNQINTETIENVIMLIKIWQDQVVEAETVITTAVNYLTDENNIDGDTTEILKKDVEQVSKNIATVKAKVGKFCELCAKVNKTFDSVKVSSDAKFKDVEDRLVQLRMKLHRVGNK